MISDLSPLDGIRNNITLLWHDNPAFPKGGPKIEGPWLWAVLLDTTDDGKLGDTDLLAEVSGGRGDGGVDLHPRDNRGKHSRR